MTESWATVPVKRVPFAHESSISPPFYIDYSSGEKMKCCSEMRDFCLLSTSCSEGWIDCASYSRPTMIASSSM